MISLILTLFISLLSLGSPIYRLEENSESRISIISNDSFNLQESKPILNSGYIDEYGTQANMFNVDFLSGDFITTFITMVAGNSGSQYSNLSFSNLNTYNVVFHNLDTCFFTYFNNSTFQNELISVTDISINKANIYDFTSSTEGGEYPLYSYRFYLSFYNGNSPVLQYEYLITSAVYDSSYHEYGGAQCYRSSVYYMDSRLQNIDWVYFENTNDGTFCPMIYYYIDRDSFAIPSINANSWNDGFNAGRQVGYNEGLNDHSYDTTALTIFGGIMGIALVPINMFLKIFNFEILGINLSGFISGILTVAVVVIIIRMITGGKKDD